MRFGREGIVIVILIVLVVGVYILRSPSLWASEGFNAQATADHNTFTKTQQATRNDLGFGLASANAQGNLGTDTQPLFGTTTLVGSGEAVPKTSMTNPYPLNDGKQGLFGKIKMCEDVVTADPNSFDNAEFAKDCGVCFDIGKDSNNKPKTGGLLVLEPEKQYARKYLKRGNRVPEYKPTFGSCPAGRLATNKEEALRIQADIKCRNGKDFNLPNCSQCFSDGNFYPTDPAVINHSTIYLNGRGKLTIKTTSGQITDELSETEPGATVSGQSVELKEGETISIKVEPLSDTDNSPNRVMLYGYVEGYTAKGKFQMDLKRLVQLDNVSKSKVRTRGFNTKTTPQTNILTPAAGQKSMDLQVYIPFSFADSDTLESDNCPDGPFVMKQASAEFLESDPCYKKGSGPGAYTKECLQGLFISNGCTDRGTGFPSEQRTMTDLMYASGNKARPLADIANYIYDQAVRAAMGMSQSGQKLSITEWSASSVFCTGKVISSVCDLPGNDVGPVSADCLALLWNNEGAGKPLGDTYLNTLSGQSLKPATNVPLFCTGEGTASPFKADGTLNRAAIEMYRKMGGLENVRAAIREIHRKANDSSLPEEVKKEAILQCYGKTPAAPPLPVGAKPTSICKAGCGPKVRKVRIQIPGGHIMNFSEIVIRDTDGKNIGLGKNATSTSLYMDGITKASNVLSGVEGPRSHWTAPHEFHNSPPYPIPGDDYWEVDLGGDFEISSITLYNRGDCCQDRMTAASLILYSSSGTQIERRGFSSAPIQTFYFGTASQDCLKCTAGANQNSVFLVGKDGVRHVKEEGSTICGTFGAQQATYKQLVDSQVIGADTCETGFVSDSASLVNPISFSTNCGSKGVNSQTPQTNDQWVWIANEGTTGTVPIDNTQVRYGKFNNWVYRNVNRGNVDALNSVFGDPIYGVYKQLDYKKPAAKLTGKIWCYGPRPGGDSVIDGGRRAVVGGQSYNVTNFSPSSYGQPPPMPGGSV